MFSTELKNNEIRNLMKIPPVGAELSHAEKRTGGRTEMKKLIVAFRYFTGKKEGELFFRHISVLGNTIAINLMGQKVRLTIRNFCS
jgi:hypothetical protein